MINKPIYEDGNGGNIDLSSRTIGKTEALYVMIYLRLFGGNVDASTKQENPAGKLRSDWWGNDSTENEKKWVNSETERILVGITINQSALKTIKSAVVLDLKKIEDIGDFSVEVSFPRLNTVGITITVVEEESTEYEFLWDATKREVIKNIIL